MRGRTRSSRGCKTCLKGAVFGTSVGLAFLYLRLGFGFHRFKLPTNDRGLGGVVSVDGA